MDRPEDRLPLVALDRLKRCPDEVSNTFWPPDHPTGNQTTASHKKHWLRAANVRKGKYNINRTYYYYLLYVYACCNAVHAHGCTQIALVTSYKMLKGGVAKEAIRVLLLQWDYLEVNGVSGDIWYNRFGFKQWSV